MARSYKRHSSPISQDHCGRHFGIVRDKRIHSPHTKNRLNRLAMKQKSIRTRWNFRYRPERSRLPIPALQSRHSAQSDPRRRGPSRNTMNNRHFCQIHKVSCRNDNRLSKRVGMTEPSKIRRSKGLAIKPFMSNASLTFVFMVLTKRDVGSLTVWFQLINLTQMIDEILSPRGAEGGSNYCLLSVCRVKK